MASTAALTIFIRAYLGARESLRDVKVLAKDILASIDIGVMTTNQNGSVMSINPMGHQLLSNSQVEIGSKLDKLHTTHTPLSEICQHVLKHHDCVRERDYEVKDNGHTRTLRAGCSLLRDASECEQGTVIHVRDVTEKVLLDKRMARMERHMGLGTLATGLHHEIKNPLSALSLHVQLLRENFLENNPTPEMNETMEVLSSEVSRITNVLERFRDYTSISTIHPEDVDPAILIEKLIRLLEPQAKQTGIEIVTVLPPAPRTKVTLDTVGFEQVLLNLALNGIESMPEGGTLTFHLEYADNQVRFHVQDTGNGIPSDLSERVFDPYFTTRNSGTGMGLAVCEKIIQLHQGTIDFESCPEGTTFSISLNLDHKNEL